MGDLQISMRTALCSVVTVSARTLGGMNVFAADGDCCTDLEERVAKLEATATRTGHKKVSIQIYGKMNRMVEFWDDGAERNAYVAQNSYSPTRFGLKGTAKIGGAWSSGYRLEVEDSSALSKELNQIDDDGRFGRLRMR